MNYQMLPHLYEALGAEELLFVETHIDQLLPPGWSESILEFAQNNFVERRIFSSSVTSRELSQTSKVTIKVVDGLKIKAGLPWLFQDYGGLFYDLARESFGPEILLGRNERSIINLNIQSDRNMHYECHVDTCALQGVLYATTHKKGGALVISKDTDAFGIDAISSNSVRIMPERGKLIFFDGRKHPHFVEPLGSDDEMRVSVALNYFSTSWGEEMRPKDLDGYLYGE